MVLTVPAILPVSPSDQFVVSDAENMICNQDFLSVRCSCVKERGPQVDTVCAVRDDSTSKVEEGGEEIGLVDRPIVPCPADGCR